MLRTSSVVRRSSCLCARYAHPKPHNSLRDMRPFLPVTLEYLRDRRHTRRPSLSAGFVNFETSSDCVPCPEKVSKASRDLHPCLSVTSIVDTTLINAGCDPYDTDVMSSSPQRFSGVRSGLPLKSVPYTYHAPCPRGRRAVFLNLNKRRFFFPHSCCIFDGWRPLPFLYDVAHPAGAATSTGGLAVSQGRSPMQGRSSRAWGRCQSRGLFIWWTKVSLCAPPPSALCFP